MDFLFNEKIRNRGKDVFVVVTQGATHWLCQRGYSRLEWREWPAYVRVYQHKLAAMRRVNKYGGVVVQLPCLAQRPEIGYDRVVIDGKVVPVLDRLVASPGLEGRDPPPGLKWLTAGYLTYPDTSRFYAPLDFRVDLRDFSTDSGAMTEVWKLANNLLRFNPQVKSGLEFLKLAAAVAANAVGVPRYRQRETSMLSLRTRFAKYGLRMDVNLCIAERD